MMYSVSLNKPDYCHGCSFRITPVSMLRVNLEILFSVVVFVEFCEHLVQTILIFSRIIGMESTHYPGELSFFCRIRGITGRKAIVNPTGIVESFQFPTDIFTFLPDLSYRDFLVCDGQEHRMIVEFTESAFVDAVSVVVKNADHGSESELALPEEPC